MKTSVIAIALFCITGCTATGTSSMDVAAQPDELLVYPPICVTHEQAEALLTSPLLEPVARRIAEHNGTVENRHGDGTVKRECPEP